MAFHGWTQSQVGDIIAVYEDRHDVILMASGGTLLTKSLPFKRTKVGTFPLSTKIRTPSLYLIITSFAPQRRHVVIFFISSRELFGK